MDSQTFRFRFKRLAFSDRGHYLVTCSHSASEEKWIEYLAGSGLLDPYAKPSQHGPSHKLAIAGGPDDFKGSGSNGVGAPLRQRSLRSGSKQQRYAIISIMGPQSSGRSTILNKLFGTRFDVDHTRGRYQVTTGVWTGSCPKGTPILRLRFCVLLLLTWTCSSTGSCPSHRCTGC